MGRARRGRADHAGTLAQVRRYIAKETRLACVFDFGAPSRIRTCAYGSRVQSRIQPLPAGTRPALMHGACMGRAKSSFPAPPSAAIDSHDPEGHTLH